MPALQSPTAGAAVRAAPAASSSGLRDSFQPSHGLGFVASPPNPLAVPGA